MNTHLQSAADRIRSASPLIPACLLCLPLGLFLAGMTALFLGIQINAWTALAGLSAGLLIPLFAPSGTGRATAVAVSAFSLLVAMVVAGFFFDFSYDGFGYHKPAVTQFVGGWNPIADGSSPDGVVFWTAFYPKASWVVGAQLVALTGNLETAKAINALALLAAILSSWNFLHPRLSGRPGTAALGALLMGLNPVSVYQLLTSYVDGLLASLVLIQALALAELLTRPGSRRHWFEACAAALLLINLKFTGLAYAGLAFAVFMVFHFRRDGLRAALRPALGIGLVTVFATFVCGKSPYTDNLLAGRHLFYPVKGSGSFDIMGAIRPVNLNDLDRVSRFLVAQCSRSESVRPPASTRLRWPFQPTSIPKVWLDIEAGGFGPLYAEAMVLSALLLCVWRFRPRVGAPAVFLALVFLLGGFMHAEAWWARYSPQLFLPPLLVALAALRAEAPARRRIAQGIVGILCLNVTVIGLLAVGSRGWLTIRLNRELDAMRAAGPVEIDWASDRPALEFSLRHADIDFRPTGSPDAGPPWRPIPGALTARWRPIAEPTR